MIKNKKKLVDLGVSESAIAALESGKGARVIGGSNAILVGFNGKVLGVDFRSSIIQDREDDLDAAEFRALSDEEKLQHGRRTEWFVVTTNNGDISFTCLFGTPESQKAEFWADGDGVNKADDFDVEKTFKPSSRVPLAWIESGCDGIIGKTITAVARKEWNNGYFDTKAVAFVVA